MSYMGNTNTKVFHEYGCRAIDMMVDEHKKDTETGEGYRPCCWCNPSGGSYQSVMDDYELEIGIQECHDPNHFKTFKESGCLSCHAGVLDGTVKMFPDDGGVEVQGQKGKFWVYLECNKCGYQSA